MRPSRDSAFKQFESLAWGYRAIFVLLDTYRIRYGLDTIRGMISRWRRLRKTTPKPTSAPWPTPSESRTGQPLDTRDRTTMLRMAAAVSRVENGAAADMGEVELGWELFVRDKPAIRLTAGGRRKETVNGDGLRGSAKNRQQTKTETPHPNITQNNPNLLSLQR